MELIINDKSYKVSLENNETVKELINMLPMTITMDDLNSNEKYCYLDKSLPTNSQSVETINRGDLMLFGNNCIVLFYETFSTSYQYTKIGHLDDVSNLKEELVSHSVEVTFKSN